MSITYFASQPGFSAIRTEAWRQVFGMMARETREGAGRSVEEAASLAGMESSEWTAVESGYIPADPGRLRSMAAALEIRFEQMAIMVFICQSAWKG